MKFFLANRLATLPLIILTGLTFETVDFDALAVTLTETNKIDTNTTGQDTSKKNTFKNAVRSSEICRLLHHKYAAIFLRDKKNLVPLLQKQGYHTLLKDDSVCREQASRLAYVSEIMNILDLSEGKIAYLTTKKPREGDPLGDATWEGIKLALRERNIPTQKHLTRIFLSAEARNIEGLLLRHIIEEKVSGFIVDVESKYREQVLVFINNFFTPNISLFPKPAGILSDSRTIHIFPDESYLAQSLAIIAQKRGLNKIAVMRPSPSRSDNFISHFLRSAKDLGIRIIGPLSYSMDNYEDLSAKVKSLIIAAPDQFPAIADGSDKKNRLASTDPKMLTPVNQASKLTVDAVLVPDTFLNTVHISKIFKFHGIPKTLFIGNHLWRQMMVLEAKSRDLNGSFFVDFIGSYSDLPTPLIPKGFAQDLILPTQVAAQIDFKLLGYKSARLFIEAGAFNEKRKKTIMNNLNYIIANEKKYPSLTLRKSYARWPSHLFEVNRHGIELLGAR